MLRRIKWLVCLACASIFSLLACAQNAVPTSAPPFDGQFRLSPATGIEEAYMATIAPTSHAANLLRLQNGDLLCFWFSGTREGESGVAIVMARLTEGSNAWSATVEVDHEIGRSFQNPVAFQTQEGRIWLLHTSQPAGEGQMHAEILSLTSDDNGHSWTGPHPIFTDPGSFDRHPPVLVHEKTWLLPMYYTPSRTITDGAEADYSAIKITHDRGKSWKECRIPRSDGLVQPSVVQISNRLFLALFRSRFADFIYQSTSHNGCNWTAPTPTRLPNNNSSIQLAKLRDGSLVVVFNNSSARLTRGKPATSVRKPLSIALSQNNGATWPWIRDIETGASFHTQTEGAERHKIHEEYSYPSVLQDAQGRINVAYSYSRETIKVVRLNEEWIKQGSTEGKFKGDGPK